MAGGLKVGDDVNARVDKLRMPNWAADNLACGWRSKYENGKIIGLVGEGRKKQFQAS